MSKTYKNIIQKQPRDFMKKETRRERNKFQNWRYLDFEEDDNLEENEILIDNQGIDDEEEIII